MNVEEIKEQRRRMEIRIAEVLNLFSLVTGTTVTLLEVERKYLCDPDGIIKPSRYLVSSVVTL